MGLTVRLATVAALSGLFLAGCSETGSPRESTYHITCWSANTRIYEGDVSNIVREDTTWGFDDEDGQRVGVTGNCVIEKNIDRSTKK